MPRILLVDDSKVSREVLKVYLAADGLELLEAQNGEDAVAIIRQHRPNLVIADMRMPKLDGPGLCRRVGEDPEIAATPIVILTSMKDEASRNACLSAGAREMLAKPVDVAALKAAVERYLKAT